jgi:hypothetical protein
MAGLGIVDLRCIETNRSKPSREHLVVEWIRQAIQILLACAFKRCYQTPQHHPLTWGGEEPSGQF